MSVTNSPSHDPLSGPAIGKAKPRRFIAGAKCPTCGLEDKIVMYTVADQKFYECIKCGHKEAEAKADIKAEPAAQAATAATDATPLEQVLKFHPAPKKVP